MYHFSPLRNLDDRSRWREAHSLPSASRVPSRNLCRFETSPARLAGRDVPSCSGPNCDVGEVGEGEPDADRRDCLDECQVREVADWCADHESVARLLCP